MHRKALGLALSLACLSLVACPRPNYRTPISRNLKKGGNTSTGGTAQSQEADKLVKNASGCLPLQQLVQQLLSQSGDVFVVHTRNLELGVTGASVFTGTDKPTRLENLLKNSLLPNAGQGKNGARPVLLESLVGKDLATSAQVGALLAVKNQADCTSVTFSREDNLVETFKVIDAKPSLPQNVKSNDAKTQASLKLLQQKAGTLSSPANKLVLLNETTGETRTYTAKPGKLIIEVVGRLPKSVASCSGQNIGLYKADYVVNYGNPADAIGLDSNFAILLKRALVAPPSELVAMAPGDDTITIDPNVKAKTVPVAAPKRTLSLPSFEVAAKSVWNGDFSDLTCESEAKKK